MNPLKQVCVPPLNLTRLRTKARKKRMDFILILMQATSITNKRNLSTGQNQTVCTQGEGMQSETADIKQYMS